MKTDLGLIVVALALAALRVAGHASQAFQAAAHLYVGFLFGRGFTPCPPHPRRLICTHAAFGLTIVEAICFAISKLS